MARPTPYAKSFARFLEITGGSGRPKPDATARPRHDDDDPGPSLFRTRVEDCALERMTLPGLFIGRSELVRVSFGGSILRSSTLSWNDFVGCWFERTDLRGSDLRGSRFERCAFTKADLGECDLRHSDLEHCDLSGASMRGAIVATAQRITLTLSQEQLDAIAWTDDPGASPPGG